VANKVVRHPIFYIKAPKVKRNPAFGGGKGDEKRKQVNIYFDLNSLKPKVISDLTEKCSSLQVKMTST